MSEAMPLGMPFRFLLFACAGSFRSSSDVMALEAIRVAQRIAQSPRTRVRFY